MPRALLSALGLAALAACGSSTPKAKSDPAPSPPPAAVDEAMPLKIGELTRSLADQMSALDKKLRLAVLPFTDDGGRALSLGKYVSDKIVNGLGKSEHYNLIERSRLDQVMRELKLSASGEISDDTVASLGNLLGADALVIGTFTDLGGSVDVNCRIVEPETGLILGSASTVLARSAVVDKLWAPPGASSVAGGPGPKSGGAAGNGASTGGSGGVGGAKKARVPPMEPGVNRPGGDYKHFTLDDANPRLCQRACAEDATCQSFTFGKKHEAGKAHCWLKSGQPRPHAGPKFISGVKSEALTESISGNSSAREERSFANPVFEGRPIAYCMKSGGGGCGQVVANEWCKRTGWDHARHFTALPGRGKATPTVHIGDGGFCNGESCDGFSMVICAR